MVFQKIIPARAGQVVVVSHDGRELIKRVDKSTGSHYWILGDNVSQSTDSRSFGWLDKTAILGVLIMHISTRRNSSRAIEVRYPRFVWLSYVAAAAWTLLLLCLLFQFEDVVIIAGTGLSILFNMPTDETTGKLLAGALVTSMLFSLPYMLRMRLSRLARVSSVVSIGVASILLTIAAGLMMVKFQIGLALLIGIMTLLGVTSLVILRIFPEGIKSKT